MAVNSFSTNIANTGSIVDHVANINVMFNKGFESFVDYINSMGGSMRQFYITRYEGQNAGITFRCEEPITGLGIASEVNEGNDFSAGTIAPGYYKDVTVYRRSYTLPWTWYFVYHNKYPDQITRLVQETGWSVAYRMELDATHPFTFGTATTYTNKDGRSVDISAGDTLQMFYSLHALTNSSTTYRNRLAGNPQISSGAIEAAENLTNQQIYDNNGIRRPARKDTIVVASDQTSYNVALKIVNSTAPREEAHAGVYNPYMGKYRIVRSMWFDSDANGAVDSTKSKYWMMVDSRNLGAYLYVTENPRVTVPTTSNGGVDYYNENETVKATATYEPVVLDPRFVTFSAGDGSA